MVEEVVVTVTVVDVILASDVVVVGAGVVGAGVVAAGVCAGRVVGGGEVGANVVGAGVEGSLASHTLFEFRSRQHAPSERTYGGLHLVFSPDPSCADDKHPERSRTAIKNETTNVILTSLFTFIPL